MKTKLKSFFASNGAKSVLSSLLCIIAGILVGFIVLLILALTSDSIPISDAFKGLGIILAGPFASGASKNIAFVLGDMLFESAPLLLTGLSVAIAFKTGLFNIGAPGQYLMGAMGSVIVALSIPTTPATAFWVWLLSLIVGMLCGMLFPLIGIFVYLHIWKTAKKSIGSTK